VLGSRLGVAGTVLGAALVSVISAVAGSLYTQSLRRTREMIRARELLSARELMTRAGRSRPLPAIRGSGPALRNGDVAEEEIEQAVDEATPSVWSRIAWKPVAITAAVVFVIAALVITGTELLTGKSLSGSQGTTVSHVVGGGGSKGTPSKQPAAPTSTSTPSNTPSTLPSRAPMESIPPSATATSSASPTGLPTDTSSPTAGTPTPSGSPTP
jgi:hypothetical protein